MVKDLKIIKIYQIELNYILILSIDLIKISVKIVLVGKMARRSEAHLTSYYANIMAINE